MCDIDCWTITYSLNKMWVHETLQSIDRLIHISWQWNALVTSAYYILAEARWHAPVPQQTTYSNSLWYLQFRMAILNEYNQVKGKDVLNESWSKDFGIKTLPEVAYYSVMIVLFFRVSSLAPAHHTIDTLPIGQHRWKWVIEIRNHEVYVTSALKQKRANNVHIWHTLINFYPCYRGQYDLYW